MTHDEAIESNIDKANEQLNRIQGDSPTAVVQAAMAVANAFLSVALVEAVRELTGEIRKAREGRGA